MASPKVAAARNFFVRHVNPKFIHFDKPFLLALSAAFFSAVIFGIILWQLLIDCTITQVSKTGGEKSQVYFVAATLKSGAKLCVHSTKVYSTFTSDFNGLEVLQEDPCVVGEGFVGKWPKNELEGHIPKKLIEFAEEGVEWCDDAVLKTQSECDKYAQTACPPCDPARASNGRNLKKANTVFNVVYEETRCPSNTHMIGVALSYTSQCDALLSLIIVFFLMASRLVHQLGANGKEGLCASVKAQAEAIAKSDAEAIGKSAINAA